MSPFVRLFIHASTPTSIIPLNPELKTTWQQMDQSLCAEIVATVNNLDGVLLRPGNNWDTLVSSARDFIMSLEAISFFSETTPFASQTHTVDVLQRLAYHDVDSGAVADIADWCLERWLQLQHHNPNNIAVLRGLGQWWLSKAQPCLSRIHAIDGSNSSSDGPRRRHGSDSAASLRSSTDERPTEVASQASHSSDDAEQRLYTADYVEARGILLPAVDYFRHAVEEATNQDLLTGNLLVTAAEAYMSLGNVSRSRVSQEYFSGAINYLRTASQIPGFPLPAHLQRYLDDYGRFVG